MKKIAIVTIVTKKYIPGCLSMLRSFLCYNKKFNGDIVIFCCDKEINKALFKLNYKKIKFIDISNRKYCKTNFNRKTYCTINSSYNANNRLEIFKLKYDKIMFVDSDIIFNKPILHIFSNNNDFVAVSTSKQHLKSVNRKKYFDAGLMIISKKYLNLLTYKKIKKYSTSSIFRDDEEILNNFFCGKVNYIEKKFNVLIHEINSKNICSSVALQYVGEKKPWFGNNISSCFDDFTIKEILCKNKNGLFLLRKALSLFKKI